MSSSAWNPALLFSPAVVYSRHEYNHVFGIYVPIAMGVFAVIVGVTLLAVLRYRRRAPERAARWYEHNTIEGSYAVVLALTVAFLLYITFSAEHRVDTVAAREAPQLTVVVTGAKWEWQFFYPAYGISVRSGTVGRQPLVVPTNEPVRFELRSADVIHALWVPELRYKRDLIPGATETVTLTFDRPGVFGGQCAEFCGLRHPEMVFTVHAVAGARFRAWASSPGRGPAP